MARFSIFATEARVSFDSRRYELRLPLLAGIDRDDGSAQLVEARGGGDGLNRFLLLRDTAPAEGSREWRNDEIGLTRTSVSDLVIRERLHEPARIERLDDRLTDVLLAQPTRDIAGDLRSVGRRDDSDVARFHRQDETQVLKV
jgi:hypothetical protein